jgi:response regulator RpfG family c-di-GMP phosphodiesterase
MLIVHLDPNRLYVQAFREIVKKLPASVEYQLFDSRMEATRFVEEQLSQELSISLIITDYSPARINGYKFAADVKRLTMQSNIRNVPVFVLTMVSETHPIVQEGLRNGAFDLYLSKSADSSTILRAVEHLLCRNAD